MTKGKFLYEGKAKRIFKVIEDSSLVWVEFKDSFTAFNGEKKAEMEGKGTLNCQISTFVFRYLKSQGFESHWVATPSPNEMVCRRLEIIPIEVIVRNVLAGSTAKKFNFEEGTPLETPLNEFYYKDDALGDPFISEDQAMMLKAVKNREDLEKLKELSLGVNKHLTGFFSEIGIQLVDFKLEFGFNDKGEILLGDEITPDTCRLWDKSTGEKMDKDRFRRDLGNVLGFYGEVYSRIKGQWEAQL